MRYLKTYETFSENVITTLNDILVDINDEGFTFKVTPCKSTLVKDKGSETIRWIECTYEVSITKIGTKPNLGIAGGTLPIKEDLNYDQVKNLDGVKHMISYVDSLGLKLNESVFTTEILFYF